jgi:hypothetical protein
MLEEPEVQRLQIEEDGEVFEIYVETKSNPTLPELGQRPGEKGVDVVKMEEARRMIRGYTMYALSAFKDFAMAEVEEVNLKFGLKLGGKVGIPYITEGTTESNLEISVKCTFPDSSKSNSEGQSRL